SYFKQLRIVLFFVAVDFDVAAKKDIVAKEGITDLFTRFDFRLERRPSFHYINGIHEQASSRQKASGQDTNGKKANPPQEDSPLQNRGARKKAPWEHRGGREGL